MTSLSLTRLFRLGVLVLIVAATAGCNTLLSSDTPVPLFYALDSGGIKTKTPARSSADLPKDAATLIVNPPHAASGFDHQRIVFVRETHRLEYYANSKWVDTPARMITPLIVAAIEGSRTFRAVVPTPSAATGGLRLDTEIIRLQHDLTGRPSRVRFTLRAYIVNNATRQVLAWREFDESVIAQSENPYGGVVAANSAVQIVLEQLAVFCTEVAANWRLPADDAPKVAEKDLPER